VIVQQDVGVDAVADEHQQRGDGAQRELDAGQVHHRERDDDVGERTDDHGDRGDERPERQEHDDAHPHERQPDAEQRERLGLFAERRAGRHAVLDVVAGLGRLLADCRRVVRLNGDQVGVLLALDLADGGVLAERLLELCLGVRRLDGQFGSARELDAQRDGGAGRDRPDGDDPERDCQDGERDGRQLAVRVVRVVDFPDAEGKLDGVDVDVVVAHGDTSPAASVMSVRSGEGPDKPSFSSA
jgi:hypothetical protein